MLFKNFPFVFFCYDLRRMKLYLTPLKCEKESVHRLLVLSGVHKLYELEWTFASSMFLLLSTQMDNSCLKSAQGAKLELVANCRIYFVFGSRTGFSGSADRIALFPVSPNPRWRLAILKNSNGDISASDRPIYFVFGSRTLFSGSADRMALFPVSPNPRWRLAILKNSNGNISASDRPIYFVFGSRTGFSGSADRMALFPVSPNPRWRPSRHL